MKKTFKKLILVLPIAVFLAAWCQIPKNVSVMQGQNLEFKWGITTEASTKNTGRFNCKVKLFNFIPIKTVNVSVTPKMYVIPSGEAIGVKIHTDGVLVVGIGDVYGKDGKKFRPAQKAGIDIGDRIVSVNGENVENTSAFCRMVNDCGGNVVVTVIRQSTACDIPVSAVYSEESRCYKVGLWVRDSTAGIGTLTFYNPQNSTFAALGHAICDSDTKDIMTVKKGSVNPCKIRNIAKGSSGNPGELVGEFTGPELGKIVKNCDAGIYGVSTKLPTGNKVLAASRFQVKEGEAEVLCDIDGNGPVSYKIEITKVSKSADNTNKSFVIKVKDSRLIEKTGGIVQGMSGSPIMQNDMLVGAVTHVFVNDPTRGYGIFIENMIDQSNMVQNF